MDRSRYNRESDKAQYDIYKIQDLRIDHDYMEGKARDIWAVASNPPYIKNGGEVQISTYDPLKVNIASVIAFDYEFKEINAPSVNNYSLLEYTPNVNNYLTVNYDVANDVTSLRTTYRNNSLSYDAYVKDSFKYQWKLSAPIEPQITGLTAGPFNIIKNVNDKILFATDQSTPEYSITLINNVASVTSDDIGSNSVTIYNGVNDILNFAIDTFNYSLSLTGVASGQIFTLSGLVTQINSLAFAQNLLLIDPIAFVIENENRIRLTSPRDATLIGLKKVLVISGTANTTLGLYTGDISSESSARTAQNIVDEINIGTSPEVTATVFSFTKIQLQAQNHDGYISLLPTSQNAYSTLGLATATVQGAVQIDFAKDVILTTAMINDSGSLQLSTVNRTNTFKIVDGNVGWKETFIFSGGSGDVIYEETFTLTNNYYVVGAGELELHNNGKYLSIGIDYDEIGTAGTRSTTFIVYEIVNNDIIEARIPKSSPSNFQSQTIARDNNVVQLGFTGLNFGPEFTVQGTSGGIVTISAGQFSGAVLQHAFNHEFGGNDEIDVTNLAGLLRYPQKTNFFSEGSLLYSRTGINISGAGITIRDVPLSGFIDINVPETRLVNIDGDTVIRLGRNDAETFSSLIIQDSGLGNLWSVYVDNYGQLATQLVESGIPFTGVIQSQNSLLWSLDIEVVFGSGEIKTSLTPTGTAVNFALLAPNGASWDLKVMDDGTIYTIDGTNMFQVRDGQNNELFTVSESGINYLSGDVFNLNVNTVNLYGNLINLNVGQSIGSGIAALSGGIVMDRGVAPPATLLYSEPSNGWVINPIGVSGAVFRQQGLIATQDYVDSTIYAISGLIANLQIANDLINTINNMIAQQLTVASGVITQEITNNLSGLIISEISTLSFDQIYANNGYGTQQISNSLTVTSSGIAVTGAITGGNFTDAIIGLNTSQVGSGITGGLAGIVIGRGTEASVLFGYVEFNNKLILSTNGGVTTQNIATEPWVLSEIALLGVKKYTHTQSSPANNWNINHTLNTYDISLTIYDSGNNMVIPQSILINSPSGIVINFSSPTQGKAVIIG